MAEISCSAAFDWSSSRAPAAELAPGVRGLRRLLRLLVPPACAPASPASAAGGERCPSPSPSRQRERCRPLAAPEGVRLGVPVPVASVPRPRVGFAAARPSAAGGVAAARTGVPRLLALGPEGVMTVRACGGRGLPKRPSAPRAASGVPTGVPPGRMRASRRELGVLGARSGLNAAAGDALRSTRRASSSYASAMTRLRALRFGVRLDRPCIAQERRACPELRRQPRQLLRAQRIAARACQRYLQERTAKSSF